MCGGRGSGRRLDVGGASWAARILAAALIVGLAATTPTAGRCFLVQRVRWECLVLVGSAA